VTHDLLGVLGLSEMTLLYFFNLKNTVIPNRYGLRRFERNVEFYYEDGGENYGNKINFTSPKTRKWYLIGENEEGLARCSIIILRLEHFDHLFRG